MMNQQTAVSMPETVGSLLRPVIVALEKVGHSRLAGDILKAALANPQDSEPYVSAISLAAAIGARDLALECMRSTQNRFPDMPLARSRDFRSQQRAGRARGMPPILLNTQFKSGSMFISRRLARALALPSCYISRTPLQDRIVPEWLALFAAGGAICQEHLPPDPETVALLADSGIGRMLVHVRDPRQSMISALHHYMKRLETMPTDGLILLSELPPGYQDWPFNDRADHYLETRFADQVQWISGWATAADKGVEGLVIKLSEYSRLRNNRTDLFSSLLAFFGVPESEVGWNKLEEAPKQGSLHYRKGDVNEWRQVLSPAQAKRATEMIPVPLLTRFGWPE
jgi:hypothetical protein